jgi:hypothetical protein
MFHGYPATLIPSSSVYNLDLSPSERHVHRNAQEPPDSLSYRGLGCHAHYTSSRGFSNKGVWLGGEKESVSASADEFPESFPNPPWPFSFGKRDALCDCLPRTLKVVWMSLPFDHASSSSPDLMRCAAGNVRSALMDQVGGIPISRSMLRLPWIGR